MEEAEKLVRQGEAWEKAGEYARAEEAFCRALRCYEAAACTARARELCLTLADLDMTQGNLHGADVWYVRALKYGK